MGTGLIGASIGLRARAAGIAAIGYDARPEQAECAAGLGALERAAPLAECLACETVVVATPLEPALELLSAWRAKPPAASLVLDVCSVKVPVAQVTRGWAAFVPTHPMAGSERSGPEAARADLFIERVWMHAPAPEPAGGAVRAFIRTMGAQPLELEPGVHDRIMALT